MFRRRAADDEQSPRKPRGQVLAAGFLGVTVVMSLVVWLTGGNEDPAPPVPDQVRIVAAEPGGRAPGCRTDDSGGTELTSVPPDVRWKVVEGTRVPTSPSAGPKLVSGPLNHCFARTPTGALIAAHVIPAQLGGDGWRAVAAQQIMPEFGRDMFISQRGSVRDVKANTNASTYYGFRIVSFTPDEAVVAPLLRNTMGTVASTTVTMRWSDGDWKVLPNFDGSLYSELASVPNADIYVKWSG